MPGTLAQEAFDLRNEERDNQIGNQERKRAVRFTRGGSLENREQRQQNKNRARINDLALEMVAIRLMAAHARGRVLGFASTKLHTLLLPPSPTPHSAHSTK